MVRRLREFLSAQDVRFRFVGEERLRVKVRDLVRSLALRQCLRDHLIFALLQHLLAHMADIGDVLDVLDLVTLRGKRATDQVRDEEGTNVADVDIAIHRRPARVHAKYARLYRMNLFFRPRQRVE